MCLRHMLKNVQIEWQRVNSNSPCTVLGIFIVEERLLVASSITSSSAFLGWVSRVVWGMGDNIFVRFSLIYPFPHPRRIVGGRNNLLVVCWACCPTDASL